MAEQQIEVGPHLGHQLLEVNLADLRPTAIRYTNLPRSNFLGPYYQVGAISLQKEPVSGYASDTLDLLLYKKKKQSNPLTPKNTTRPVATHSSTWEGPLVNECRYNGTQAGVRCWVSNDWQSNRSEGAPGNEAPEV